MGRGLLRAKQRRAGSLGQSARLYRLSVGSGLQRRAFKVPGAMGFGQHNPSIGSMLSLGVIRQNRRAGGNNVCTFADQFGKPQQLCQSAEQGSRCCDCKGPKAYCPNCWNRTTKFTLATK